MSLLHTSGVRRGFRATAVASALVFALSACGGGGGDDSGSDDSKKPEGGNSSSEDSAATPGEVDTDKVIGKLKGPNGIEIAVHSAVRDQGGFVSVNGTVSNKGERTFRALEWQSGETGIKSKSSIAGATLIDTAGKKRYLVLRDTDGQCLCSTGLTGIKSGESRPVFAQFPAPPKNVQNVEFHVPSMSPAKLKLSEG